MRWQRRKLVRLDQVCLGASPEKLGKHDIPAITAPLLSNEQQAELYRLNHKQQVGTLSVSEHVLRARLAQLARGGR